MGEYARSVVGQTINITCLHAKDIVRSTDASTSVKTPVRQARYTLASGNPGFRAVSTYEPDGGPRERGEQC